MFVLFAHKGIRNNGFINKKQKNYQDFHIVCNKLPGNSKYIYVYVYTSYKIIDYLCKSIYLRTVSCFLFGQALTKRFDREVDNPVVQQKHVELFTYF